MSLFPGRGYTPGTAQLAKMSMAAVAISLVGEFTTDVLQNRHRVILSSKCMFTPIDWYSSQPWPEKLLSTVWESPSEDSLIGDPDSE